MLHVAGRYLPPASARFCNGTDAHSVLAPQSVSQLCLVHQYETQWGMTKRQALTAWE